MKKSLFPHTSRKQRCGKWLAFLIKTCYNTTQIHSGFTQPHPADSGGGKSDGNSICWRRGFWSNTGSNFNFTAPGSKTTQATHNECIKYNLPHTTSPEYRHDCILLFINWRCRCHHLCRDDKRLSLQTRTQECRIVCLRASPCLQRQTNIW